MSRTLLQIGCGNLGRIILSRAVASSLYDRIIVVQPSLRDAAHYPAVTFTPSLEAWQGTLSSADVVLLAVKPQMLPQLAPMIAQRAGHPSPLYISVAAGIMLKQLNEWLGAEARVIRTMPNIAASISESITAMTSNTSATQDDIAHVEALFSTMGQIAPLEKEAWMDAATAIAGSGPAYYYAFTQALAAAGAQAGLPESMAELLARQTFIGAAKLLAESGDALPALRNRVASPGGTTEAALAALTQNDALKKLVEDAVQAALQRAQALR